jgi:predicted lipid-binding transport protein (Tim44 family)
VNAYLLSLRAPQDGLTCGDPARVPASPGSPAAPGSPTVPGSPAAPQEAPAHGGRQAGGFGPGLVVGLLVGGGVALLVAGTTMLALRRWAR